MLRLRKTRTNDRCSRPCQLAATALGIALGGPALAADLPVKAPMAVYDWTGFYVGGHFGYGGGSLGPGTNPLPEQGVLFPPGVTGLIGGYQVGYNRQFANRLVLGIEADATFTSPEDQAALGRMPVTPFNTTADYVGTVRGRIGYAFGRWMPYVTGGFAWGHTRAFINQTDTDSGDVISALGHYQTGWTAGLGIEFAVSGNWTAKLEYEYVDLSRQTYDLSGFGLANTSVEPRVSLAKFGLNYQFGDMPLRPADSGKIALPESDVWNVHAQATFLPQGYTAFRALYSGPDSLPPGGQLQNTWTTTAFLGVRLWEGGEFYFDPELAQGFGLNGTLGVGGFPNGEAQKAGAAFPKIRPQRYYVKQTFGLGGEQEDVADGPNQLQGKRDIDRVTLVVGRFAIGDFFDNNAYAHDPRADFMNWALWESASYDFPADLPGYTRGVMVELNRKNWAVRGAVVETPTQPNSDILTYKGLGTVVEFEGRYNLFEQPGKVRFGPDGRNGGSNARYQHDHGEHSTYQPEIRLLRQCRAADRSGRRPVRARKLERRTKRDPVIHRYRPQPVGRAVHQGQFLGTGERHRRHWRHHQWIVGRPSRLPRRRRPRPSDRRWPPQLSPGTNSRGLLRLPGHQELHRDGRLSIHRKSLLQCGPRSGFALRVPPARRILGGGL